MYTENDGREYDIDRVLKLLIKFLYLDKSKIQSVVNEFNNHGPNVTYTKIAALTGLDPEPDCTNIRDAFASIIHHHTKHKRDFDHSLSESKIDKRIIEQVITLIGQLNEKGLNGLDLLYAALGTEGLPTIQDIDYNLMLNEILDDDKKKMGYLPVLRLKLELLDTDDKDLYQSIFLTLEDFTTLVKKLNKIHDTFLQSATNFRRQFGDSVILVEK